MDNAIRIAIERRLVRNLIQHLRKHGFVVFRTFDGDTFEYPGDDGATMDFVFNLDEVSLRFIHKDVEARGLSHARAARHEHGVLLILGNGTDIVSDWNYYTDDRDGFNAAMDALPDPIDAIVGML
jgi:hypothetical protein